MVDILNTQKFSLLIEEFVKDKRCSYMDAIVLYCHENEIEVETAAKLINTKIKEQIEIEAIDLNYLPKVNKLPI